MSPVESSFRSPTLCACESSPSATPAEMGSFGDHSKFDRLPLPVCAASPSIFARGSVLVAALASSKGQSCFHRQASFRFDRSSPPGRQATQGVDQRLGGAGARRSLEVRSASWLIHRSSGNLNYGGKPSRIVSRQKNCPTLTSAWFPRS